MPMLTKRIMGHFISPILFLMLIFSCSNPETTIHVSIQGECAELLYTNPELDICYEKFTEKISMDKDIELKFSLSENKFMLLQTPVLEEKYILPMESGESYRLDIHENNQIHVSGPNKDGIELYQSVLQHEAGKLDWGQFKGNLSSETMMKVEDFKQKELSGFKKLLAEKKITDSFYRLIEKDRDCFYAFVLSYLLSQDMLRMYRNDPDQERKDGLLTDLSHVFMEYPTNDKKLLSSPSWHSYALLTDIKLYRQYSKRNVDKNNIERLFSPENGSFWFEEMKESFSGSMLEAILAIYINENNNYISTSFSENMLPVYDYFNNHFPQSKYSIFIKDQMDNNIDFFMEREFDSSFTFMSESKDDRLSSILSQMKGKKVLVEIWSIGNLNQYGELTKDDSAEVVLQDQNVQPLYIYLDKNQNLQKLWKSVIFKNNLNGVHVRAHESLIAELREIHEKGHLEGDIFSNPWYILINEKGEIEQLIKKEKTKPAVPTGSVFVDFEGVDPFDLGKKRKLSDYIGKDYLVVDFWASWCAPCIIGMDNLRKVYDKYKGKGLEIVGVIVSDKIESSLEMQKKLQLPWPQIFDPTKDKIRELYGISSIPTLLLINKDGKIILRTQRGKDISDKIEELLSK